MSPRNLFDLIRLLSSFELLNDRWQRVPCPKIRSNEINFPPRQGHTRVPKIREIYKNTGRGGAVHVEIRQCEIPRQTNSCRLQAGAKWQRESR
jgi:hypothetical protein